MGWVKLKRLVLHNFRTFKGRHEIELPDTGLVILKGPSGSGKTNILLGLAYAFRHCPHSAKDLQCWHTEDPMSVEVHMETHEGSAVLVRGEKLSLTIAGKVTKGSAKAVEERLDLLCGIGPSLREALTYRDQREPKKVLSMDDRDLKKFLTQVLGLEELEAEVAAAVKRVGPLEKQLGELQALAKAAEDSAVTRRSEAVEPVLADLTRLEQAVVEAELNVAMAISNVDLNEHEVAEAAKAESVASRAIMAEFEAKQKELESQPVDTTERDRLVALRTECQGHLRRLMLEDAKAQNAYEAETHSLTMELRHLHNEMARIPGIMDSIKRLEHEVEKLDENVCPTCERVWASATERKQECQKEIQGHQENLDAIRAHHVLAEELDKRIKSRRFLEDPRVVRLRDVDASLKEQVAVEEEKLKGARVALGAKIMAMKAEARGKQLALSQDPDRPLGRATRKTAELMGKLSAAKAEVLHAQSELALAKQGQELAQKAYAQAVERVLKAEEQVRGWGLQVQAAEKQVHQESDYLDLLRGFRNKIFDEVLEGISTESTNIVADLPNAQHIAIEFKSERETGSGSIEQRIRPVVYIHGVERSLKASVSGGQFTSIELATDLAMTKVVSNRLGCNLQWVILDESFDGHDPATKEACIGLLQQYAADKLVIIVDHTSEFKEMFTQELVVEYNNQLSTVRSGT